MRFDDLDVFYLAGGFGRNLNVASAKRIGLIPDIEDAKILQVGNAAIEGACMALLSRAETRRAGGDGQARDPLPAGDASGLLPLLRGGLPVQSGHRRWRCPTSPVLNAFDMLELIDTHPDCNVQEAEYSRLLGYPGA